MSCVSPWSSGFFCPGPSVLLSNGWSSGLNDGDLTASIHPPRDGARLGHFSRRATAVGAETGTAPLPRAQSQRHVSILFFNPISAFIGNDLWRREYRSEKKYHFSELNKIKLDNESHEDTVQNLWQLVLPRGEEDFCFGRINQCDNPALNINYFRRRMNSRTGVGVPISLPFLALDAAH